VKNKQRWLTKKIKGDYIENEDLIRVVMFETFLHYIEEELSLITIFAGKKHKEISVDDFFSYTWSEDLEEGHVTKPQVKKYTARLKELKKAYLYITQEREILNKRFYQTIKTDESEQIENEMNEKDQQTLAIILKHRLTLWT
jgi:hypothetical protein